MGDAERKQVAAAAAVSEDLVRDALMGVVDPELGLDVVDLGLVYGIEMRDFGLVVVRMTLTTPVCPYGPELIQAVVSHVEEVPGVSQCQVELVWEPVWDPRTMASRDAKTALGLFDDF